jgi:hypothetical protein
MLADQLAPENRLPDLLAREIAAIIKRGIAVGEFRTMDALLVSRFIASTHMYLLGPTASDRPQKDLVEKLCDFELTALGVDTAKTQERKRKGSGR